jgi:enolase
MKIRGISAREILDSRGTPTVEVVVTLEDGVQGTASVPSGKSTGSREAHELRDGEARFGGRGVRKAVAAVEGEILGALKDKDFSQQELDHVLCELDGTPNKSRLGANALLGVSLACARASARSQDVPLYRYIAALAKTTPRMPQPCFNIINGGAHADSGLHIQEFMLIPAGDSVVQKIERAAAVQEVLYKLIKARGLATGVGDEGGFAPMLPSNAAALDLLVEAINTAAVEAQFGIDAAANFFYKDGLYEIDPQERHDRTELLAWYEELVAKYPIVSLEDPFAEDDWDGFVAVTKALGEKIRIVGDDLLTTNPVQIQLAGERRATNTALIKPNQIGTLSEALDACTKARESGMMLFASHRSGETNDDCIADFAVGVGAEYLKAGALTRGERVAKYNRLIAIEQELS